MAARKIVLLTAIVVFMANVVSLASAAEPVHGDPLRKLGRGISNCLTFPLELPNQISKTNNNDGPMAAFTYGIVKGLTMTMFRAVVGAYEVISFPIPLPEWYKPILTDPEFMLEEWNV